MAKDIQLMDNGDVFIGSTGIKHTNFAEPSLMQRLLESNVGSLVHTPLTGAGVKTIPNGRIDQNAIKRIAMQLDADNWTDAEIDTEGGNIQVYANRL